MTKSRGVGRGAKPDKLMRDALILALMREAEGADGRPTKKLHLIAARLVEKAVDGDIAAIREINDRVDGKSSTEQDGALPILKRIERVIVRPQAAGG